MANHALGEDGKFDFTSLKPFEIHPKYPLSRLLSLETATVVNAPKSKLKVTLSCRTPATFDESLPVDGYRLGVVVIYPDIKKHSAKTDSVQSNTIALSETVGPLAIEFSIPRGATHFLICVRVDGCERGKLCSALSAKGMRAVEVGRIG